MQLTEKERLELEKGEKAYLEIERRKSELSEADKKLLEKVEAIEVGRYDVRYSTMIMIAKVYQNNAINAFSTIYKLGFLKGMRKASRQTKLEAMNGKKK